jgi:hypothetical protein
VIAKRPPPPSRTTRLLAAATLAAGLTLTPSGALSGHEVPASVTVLAYVKPEGRTLRLLVRVPLQSMRDMEIPRRSGQYLDLRLIAPELPGAAQLWIAEYVQLFEGGQQLPSPRVAAARIALPGRSFASYDSALATVAAPALPDSVEIPWQQALFDVMLEYQITSDRSDFSIDPKLAHLGQRTSTVLHFLPAGGTERALQYIGNPGLLRLDPHWYQAALLFVRHGIEHILDGVDHLLFILCLVIPFRKPRPLVAIVTSFTVAHSITLIAAAMGFAPSALWFPPLIEVLIALSIVYMAFENIVGPRIDRRWVVAFAFGLVHGFGFSFALRETLQFAGAHLMLSLVSFNVGVEIGQILVVAVAIPVLNMLFARVVKERVGTIILSALVAHTAWHWMTERWGVLREYSFEWPVLDAAFVAGVLRTLMLLLVMAGALWILYALARRLTRAPSPGESPAGERG